MMQHFVDDFVVTVGADVRLSELQRVLAPHRQWLPLDPPGDPTIGELIEQNLSGPRRFGYGTVRDYLLGIRVRLLNGSEIRSGGRVVKNVAGYDLGKLFVGARGRLGTVREATFKLRPLPEAEAVVGAELPDWRAVAELLDAIWRAPLMPVVVDVVSPRRVVVGVAGSTEEVAWQKEQLAALGLTQPATLDYNRPLPQRASVAPSRLVTTLSELHAEEFVARAGNGWIEYRGGRTLPMPASAPAWLQARLEAALR
ncbi:MAG: FAD-binding oxidoreductase [Verrucomicrobiae bacterium]|nr:FAD-binding oxidoreductase [Verrucomicrobiae bacterium]